MKYIKYLAIALTGVLAASCAEEEPEVVGDFNPKAYVSIITATTANITVDLTGCPYLKDLTENDYADCRVQLIAPGSTANSWEYSKYFPLASYERPGEITLVNTLSFTNLTPNTTYRYYIEIPSPVGYLCYRDDSFTFTTTRDGDYSALVDIKPYEVALGNRLAIFNFDSPAYWECKFTLSKNADLSDAMTFTGDSRAFYDIAAVYNLEVVVERHSQENYETGMREYCISFKNLEPNTTYYWAITANIETDNTTIPDLKTKTFTFTTTDRAAALPAALAEKVVKILKDSFTDEGTYCSFYNSFDIDDESGLKYNGYFFISPNADFSEEIINNRLQFSTTYYYAMRFSNISGSLNGNYINLSEYVFTPENNTFTTPAQGKK